ncbi:MAG: hypothetical protein JNL32_00150 [Candidatus Kapabacteria bacterium]|nr:hypothetical protein [Candidatus Kapabacteria bacterium]
MILNMKEIRHNATGAVKYVTAQLLPETALSRKRMSICSTCTNNINDTCSLCGCPVSEKTKFTGEHSITKHVEHCDAGKW